MSITITPNNFETSSSLKKGILIFFWYTIFINNGYCQQSKTVSDNQTYRYTEKVKFHKVRSGADMQFIFLPLPPTNDYQEVATLVNGFKTTGEHEVTWQPRGLPSGIYFYRLLSDNYKLNSEQVHSETKKLIFRK